MKLRHVVVAAAGVAFLGGLAGVGPTTQTASAQSSSKTERGQAVYERWCSHCHAAGPGHPGTQGLQIKYRGQPTPAVLVERTDLTPEVVKTFVRAGVLSMAPFRKTEITDAELDDLAAFLAKQ